MIKALIIDDEPMAANVLRFIDRNVTILKLRRY